MTNAQLDALIESIEDAGDNSAEEVRTVLQGIKNSFVFIGEVKFVKMLTEDIATYFETTGITSGKGLIGGIYQGWAICNGLNGTTNDDGLVSIAYGSTNDTLGDTGGNKDITLVAANIPKLDVTLPVTNNDTADPNYTKVLASDSGVSDTFKTYVGAVGNTSPTTVDNMQPYVVELKIQRIE